MWKCKICGATVAPTPSAVAEHYEKHHFSVFAKNGADIRRVPKAFVKEVSNDLQKGQQQSVASEPKKKNADPAKNRAENMQWLVDRIKDIDRDHTFERQEKKAFDCPCCGRTVVNGKRLKHSREDYVDICYDCFKAARKIIVALPKK
ncbi:MAG: hypothetical protein IJ776_06640 [Paludibacteraceae bacterium]|nr:hypothetical protein [Paludibacteraceae bacterium]